MSGEEIGVCGEVFIVKHCQTMQHKRKIGVSTLPSKNTFLTYTDSVIYKLADTDTNFYQRISSRYQY